MRPVVAVLAACLLAPCAGAAAQAKDAGNGTVTVYRCTDASGVQSLRDSPCPKGQKQQTREMVRPKDAPPAARAPVVSPPVPTPAVQTRTVYLAPPRPMYECTTPDGDTYTSENGDGNPRWAPFWTQGYTYAPVGARGSGSFRPAGQLSAGLSTAFPSAPASPPPSGGPPSRPSGYGPIAAGGGWVSDQCAMLPPREACARLRDRREQIRTRFFNAQEKERDVLRSEERGINARLDDDCGGR